MGNILKAKDILDELSQEILNLRSECDKTPKLVCVTIEGNVGVKSYLSSIKHVLTSDYSIDVDVIELQLETTAQTLAGVLQELSEDDEVSAIMLMRPVPSHINLQQVQKYIDPAKDVDGVNPLNIAGFWNGDDSAFGSCTAEAAVFMLEHMVSSLRGMDVVVVGRSREVGRPTAELLLRKDATVTMCHSATDDMTEHLKHADAIISCAGVAHLIDGSMIQDGSCVVNVGMAMLEGMLVGDVDLDTTLDKVSYISPAIGGVGTITTHMLAKHVIRAALGQQ